MRRMGRVRDKRSWKQPGSSECRSELTLEQVETGRKRIKMTIVTKRALIPRIAQELQVGDCRAPSILNAIIAVIGNDLIEGNKVAKTNFKLPGSANSTPQYLLRHLDDVRTYLMSRLAGLEFPLPNKPNVLGKAAA